MKYVILFFLLFSVSVQAEVITSVVVTGNINVENEVIKSQLDIKIGDEVNDDILSQVIKKLYATELFANVSLNVKDGELMVDIQENPIVNKLKIENNKSVKTSEIEEVIKVKSNSLFSKEKLQSDILEIIKLYQINGIIDVTVKPYKVVLEDNKVDIVYRIEEGEKAKIRKISFINNTSFSDYVLKAVLLSKEYKLYNFLTSNHYYVGERVSLDGSLLRNFYFTRGFLDFKIESIITEFDEYGVYINFIVDEGKKYTVQGIEVTSSITGLEIDKIKKVVEINQGEIFNINKVNQSIFDITSILHNKGYYSANVKPDYKTEDNQVTINYQITEGKKFYINKINITGNDHTLDHVIRREINISDGDHYNSILLNRSRQNIINLGFFDEVNFKTSLDGEEVDIDFIVKDRNTGFANLGGGVSSHLGLVGNFSVHESNLLGTGNHLSFSVEKASSTFNTSIGFTKPYIFDLPISSGFDLFKDSSNYQHGNSFKSSNYGFTLRSSYKVKEDLRHFLRYSYKQSNIYGVRSDASQLIKDQAGITHTSSVGYTLVYDKLDNPVKPKNGYLLKGGQDLAGIGGDLHYLRSDFLAVRFMAVKNYDEIVFQTSLKGGHIGGYNEEEIKIGQRFFMGSNDVRGFKPSGIGPRDLKTDDALGGKSRIAGTMQVDFPVGLPSDLGVKGSLFVDAGTLTNLDYSVMKDAVDTGNLRASVGFGFSWFSPVGLLRLDFGFPILKEDYDKTETLRFHMGKSF